MTEQSSAPSNTKVMDWVEQQALGDGIDTIVDDVNKTFCQSQTPNPDGRVYDIQTLLDICASVDLNKINLRIHQGALHENIFKATKVLPVSRRHVRSRGLSEVSHKSIDSNQDDVLLVGHLSYPVRQPRAAPSSEMVQQQGFRQQPIRQPKRPPPNMIGARVEGFLSFPQRLPRRQPSSPPGQVFSQSSELAQQHAGFQRFLKEHASPPHQRVTAGGRIVPAHGPPPVFNVNSLTGAVMSPSRSATAPVSHTAKSDQIPKGVENASGPRFASAASKHGIMLSRASEQSDINQSSIPLHESTNQSLPYGSNQQTQINPSMPQPLNSAPIMLLQDGTTFVMQNGLPYRVYSNGFQTFTEAVPLLFAQQAVAPGFPNANGFQKGAAPQLNYGPPFEGLQDQTITNDSVLSSHPLHSKQGSSGQDPQQQHEYLRNELQSLDRYIALNGKKFGRHEHLAFVALRKQLVQELDRYRRRLSRTSSSEATSQLYQYTSLGAQPGLRRYTDAGILNRHGSIGAGQMQWGPNLGPQTPALSKTGNESKVQPLPDTNGNGGLPQFKTPSIKSSAGASKVLSPEAPPFVPGSLRSIPARKVESCIPSGENKDAMLEARAASSSKELTSLMLNKENISHTQDLDHRPTTNSPGRMTHTRYGTSGSWSAMEAHAPDVHERDIAYVDNLGLNPVNGTKKYCSTVSEFQEVIRRVREQARLYGCKGGSSKDPEFDAEQDIRWAISDSTPVPLPKKIPDHIAYPRPWSWNDSAFNVHADRSKVHNAGASTAQQPINASVAQAPNFSLGDFKSSMQKTPPKTVESPSRGSPATSSNAPGTVVNGNNAGKVTNESSFKSSRQATILRETHKILGSIPTNTLTSNAGPQHFYGRQMDGEASTGQFAADYVSPKDPFGTIMPVHMIERDFAGVAGRSTPSLFDASPPPKLVVKLPYTRPSGSSLVPKDPTAEVKGQAGERDMYSNSEHQSKSTPPSSTGFGSSTFLGRLLRSPIFSSSKASNKPQDPSKASHYTATHPQVMTKATHKEFVKPEKGAYSGNYPVHTRTAAILQSQNPYQDSGFGKSRSSVAPTNTYVHAQMHAQAIVPEGSFQSSEWQIRHHPPSPVGSSRGVTLPIGQSPDLQSRMPQYDGAGDGSPRQSKAHVVEPGSKDKKSAREELDPKVFQTDNNDLPRGHEFVVTRFLDDIKKAEEKEIAKHPSKGAKR